MQSRILPDMGGEIYGLNKIENETIVEYIHRLYNATAHKESTDNALSQFCTPY